ncbi:hypothetical protein CYQ88_09295 [Hydrogenovibrio sp. SC-1]|uniref:hypothetical protein n=1 Tax=Hydrogenovibrio sp. SC-1 TaxID=2065820 RepID=UPI000C7A79EB|nr:hypothetical protein [Hydrogenovibrio sp. SC-1]PLA73806.1 hypothetical protein CYQ88_09295 [Hydrogenovibrio sp. SC-1]
MTVRQGLIQRLLVVGLSVLAWLPVQASVSLSDQMRSLSDADYQWVAQKLFQNEANQNPAYLTFWSAKEPFPSLGIGHFIWMPKGVDAPFVETFPEMVAFVSAHQSPPTWLQALQNSSQFKPPWPNRSHFQQAQDSIEMQQLRDWLFNTADWQARFIVQRLSQQFAEKSQHLIQQQRSIFENHLRVLLQSKKGVFALIDYSNFKGIGLNSKETYQGEGWGLINVLLAMPDAVTAETAVPEFVSTAKQLLQNRVENAKPDKNEAHWLPGWHRRLEGYLSNE